MQDFQLRPKATHFTEEILHLVKKDFLLPLIWQRIVDTIVTTSE
jgi:hypothetical protein